MLSYYVSEAFLIENTNNKNLIIKYENKKYRENNWNHN